MKDKNDCHLNQNFLANKISVRGLVEKIDIIIRVDVVMAVSFDDGKMFDRPLLSTVAS